MATTTVTFLRDYDTALTAKLVSVGGTGTPNAAGYACTNTNGLQSISITEALVGEFYAYAYDSLGDIAYQGYVVLADDTGTYRIEDSLSVITAATQATAAALDAEKSRQFITNKRTREVLGPRQIRYTIRNDDDSADAFSIDYDPQTGNIATVV